MGIDLGWMEWDVLLDSGPLVEEFPRPWPFFLLQAVTVCVSKGTLTDQGDPFDGYGGLVRMSKPNRA